jgi:uncharacterized membrane protein
VCRSFPRTILNRHDPSGLGSLASVPAPQRATGCPHPQRVEQAVEQRVEQPQEQAVHQPEEQAVHQPVEQYQPVEQEPDYGGR